MTDQKAPEGLQERREPPSGHRAVRGAENGPQTATHGLALRKLIAGTIRDTPARYPDDIADAVWRVVQAALREQRDRQAEQTVELVQRTADLQIALREVLGAFRTWPGSPPRCQATVTRADFDRWHATLQPARNAGPTAAECAAQDRAYWTDKHAGDQP